MPVSIEIIPELDLVHIVYTGTITLRELYTAYGAMYKDPNYQRGMPEVNDLSQITEVDIGFDEMQRYAQQALAMHTDNREPTLVCLVGGTQVSELATSMYVSLAAAKEVPIEVLHMEGYPEVLAALNLPPQSLKLLPEFCRNESHLL